MFRKILYLLVIFIFFIYGTMVGSWKIPPHNILLYVKNLYVDHIDKKKYQNSISEMKKCNLKQIYTLPKNSTVIIGHAYGGIENHDDFISSKILKFLESNYQNIENVIFSGDVIKVPSTQKWKKLKNYSSELNLKMYIAPGNHEVSFGDNTRRDIFYKVFNQKHSYQVSSKYNEKINIVIEDSTIKNWLILDSSIDLIKKNKNKKFSLLIRHHQAVEEFLRFANSLEGGHYTTFPTMDNLLKTFNDKLYIISGDSGAYSSLPRLNCINKDNLTIISNGIGNIDGDSILILSNNELYFLNL